MAALYVDFRHDDEYDDALKRLMSVLYYAMPLEVAALSLDEIAERYSGRFHNENGDREAFEDAQIEGYRRREAHLGRP
jgi:hypothetical protein